MLYKVRNHVKFPDCVNIFTHNGVEYSDGQEFEASSNDVDGALGIVLDLSESKIASTTEQPKRDKPLGLADGVVVEEKKVKK